MYSIYKTKKRIKYFFDLIFFKILLKKSLNNKSELSVIFTNDYISNNIIAFNSYEKDILDATFFFLKKFSTKFKKGLAIDIGSNIGTHALYFSKKFNKVYTFEPHPKIFLVNKLNKKNKNIFNYDIGLSNVKKKTFIHEEKNEDNMGGSSLYKRTKNRGRSYKVNINKLDNLNISFKNLSLIKIDTEGSEHDVINGARMTINKYRPIIMFELNFSINQYGSKGVKSSALDFLKMINYDFYYPITKSTSNPFFIIRGSFYILEFFFGRKINIKKIEKFKSSYYPVVIAVPKKYLKKTR